MKEMHSSVESTKEFLKAILNSDDSTELKTLVNTHPNAFNFSFEFLLQDAAIADWGEREKIIERILPFLENVTLTRKQLYGCIDSGSQMLGEAYGFFFDKEDKYGPIRSELWQLLSGLIHVADCDLDESIAPSTTEKIAFAISVVEEELFNKYARNVAEWFGQFDERIARSLNENVITRMACLEKSKQQLEISNIESLGRIGPKSIQQIDVPVKALLDNAEEACDNLGMVLTVDPILWNEVHQARQADKYLSEGVPWEEAAGRQNDDWLVCPAELEDFEFGFAVDICCTAANAIRKIDPSGKVFWRVCQTLQLRRSPKWRPLGWITSIPEFEIGDTEKLELFRKEFQHFLSSQQWGHYPSVICDWIRCSGQLDFVFMLQLIELMLDVRVDTESIDSLFGLLATNEMEGPMNQDLNRTIESIGEKIVRWVEKDGVCISEGVMFVLACDNYLLGDQFPDQFAAAFLIALEHKHVNSSDLEVSSDIEGLINKAKAKLTSSNPDCSS